MPSVSPPFPALIALSLVKHFSGLFCHICQVCQYCLLPGIEKALAQMKSRRGSCPYREPSDDGCGGFLNERCLCCGVDANLANDVKSG